jgi:hypothetical protein
MSEIEVLARKTTYLTARSISERRELSIHQSVRTVVIVVIVLVVVRIKILDWQHNEERGCTRNGRRKR